MSNINTRLIPLTKGQFAIVDAEDYEWLTQIGSWYYSKGYAVRREKQKNWQKRGIIHMHRLINQTPKGLITDHINHNTLDNRKSNLRSCSNHENQLNRKVNSFNSAGSLGVSWHRRNKKWRAVFTPKGKNITIGYYKTIEEAAKARQRYVASYIESNHLFTQ